MTFDLSISRCVDMLGGEIDLSISRCVGMLGMAFQMGDKFLWWPPHSGTVAWERRIWNGLGSIPFVTELIKRSVTESHPSFSQDAVKRFQKTFSFRSCSFYSDVFFAWFSFREYPSSTRSKQPQVL